MQDFGRLRSPTPRMPASFVMIVVAATMIGTTTGLLLADREAFFILKENISRQLAGILGNQPASIPSADRAPEISALQNPQTAKPRRGAVSIGIPIGLSSIRAIRYSLQSGSAHMEFNLEAANLVRTGRLDNPDRIYIDLKDSRRAQGAVGRLKAQKAIRIDGDPMTGVRIAQWESGAMRIVLDLSCSCDFTCQIFPGSPSCLVVELRPHSTGSSASR
jgi:AMIN domain